LPNILFSRYGEALKTLSSLPPNVFASISNKLKNAER
jgi:hypothetical protein